jgi:energy-coupling factor transporter ATP-binding protein EcfA2
LTKQRGLGYSMDTLVNFHVSVKTNDVTILSGMSGTGKSQLALLYAEALGIYKPENAGKDRFLIVPIRPSFTQPEDLMGYLNSSTGLFVPSDTGLVDLLVKASKDTEHMYMVLFDEMNLAQVEHWFAPFISLLELPIEQRVIQLYSPNQTCHNKSDYPATIQLGDNLLFVGTANMDETTRGFSDRLLDRVNIVVPEKMSFVKFVEDRARFNDEGYGSEVIDDFGKVVLFKRWVSEGDPWTVFHTYELTFFDELHRMIQKADHQKGVSFRTLKKMAEFIRSIPKDKDGASYLDRRTIIDLQVKQRILTKIRGSSEQFRELIGESADGNNLDSQLTRQLTSEQAEQISNFEKSLAEVKRKARELFIYEYAS